MKSVKYIKNDDITISDLYFLARPILSLLKINSYYFFNKTAFVVWKNVFDNSDMCRWVSSEKSLYGIKIH